MFPCAPISDIFWVKSQWSITLNNSKYRMGRSISVIWCQWWKSHLVLDNYNISPQNQLKHYYNYCVNIGLLQLKTSRYLSWKIISSHTGKKYLTSSFMHWWKCHRWLRDAATFVISLFFNLVKLWMLWSTWKCDAF